MAFPLGGRLECAAELFPSAMLGADIGANHGKLGISLLMRRKVQHMWLTDRSADALRYAKENAAGLGLDDRISWLVSDGFEGLPEGIEAAAILGMGGKTIASILEKARVRLGTAEELRLVLSPNTEMELVRRTLYAVGYAVTAERIAFENKRYYVVMLAEKTGRTELPDERALFLGPCLMRESSRLYGEFLASKIRAYTPGRGAANRQRLQWYTEELERVGMHCQNGIQLSE